MGVPEEVGGDAPVERTRAHAQAPSTAMAPAMQSAPDHGRLRRTAVCREARGGRAEGRWRATTPPATSSGRIAESVLAGDLEVFDAVEDEVHPGD